MSLRSLLDTSHSRRKTVKTRIAACSWSFRPGSANELIEGLRAAGIARTQLALDPIRTGEWPEIESREALERAGIGIVSGMMGTAGEDYSTLDSIRLTGGVRPDEHWAANRAAAEENARLAKRLGLKRISLHAGFLPEEREDPERARMIERLREVVDLFAAEGVGTLFETGQETAGTLVEFLEELDRPMAGVNFDPANMLLYDKGDPAEALDRLSSWVRQMHIKDALRTKTPGTWGEEVAAGRGEVDWTAVFDLIAQHGLEVDLVIEREAGEDRIGEIRSARELVVGQLQRIGAMIL